MQGFPEGSNNYGLAILPISFGAQDETLKKSEAPADS
jgi:hypothetical protein